MLKDVTTGLKKNKTLYAVVCFVVIMVIIYFVTRIMKNIKSGAITAGDMATAPIIYAQTGITPARQQVCRDVAKQCDGAISRMWLTNTILWIEHDTVVSQLNRLVEGREAKLVSEMYTEESGASLKSAVEGGRFDFGKRSRINPVIRQNIY